MSVASLTVICDRLLAITEFLSAYFGQLFPSLTRHNKVPAFLTWLRSLSMAFVQFFIAQFSFPAKICLFLSATPPGLWTDHVGRSHHSMTSSCVYTLITHFSGPIKTRVLRCSLYKEVLLQSEEQLDIKVIPLWDDQTRYQCMFCHSCACVVQLNSAAPYHAT